ncbi:MAG TPA: cupin domain-containing protein [Polyangiaceae bacterium]|jgi:mannose-6-phosphate isomerase-like protein (cupin superfamily)|nr:cupin domain-containing protein [Polyangiaceae bacterium]
MIKNVANSEHYQWGDACDGWRLLERLDLSVIQERMRPGTSETRHYRARARQLFFVLEGQLQLELAGEIFLVSAGDSLEVPPGTRHRVYNAADVDASFLVVSAPTTQGDRTNIE